jgi:hypothetical protein
VTVLSNICKGVAGARIWRSCDDDPDRPAIDFFDGPAIRRGACEGAKTGRCDAMRSRGGNALAACEEVREARLAFRGPVGAPMTRSAAGMRDFDYNLDGLAHYGLLKDFVQDLRNIGVTEAQLRPLFRSAEDYLRIWDRVYRP